MCARVGAPPRPSVRTRRRHPHLLQGAFDSSARRSSRRAAAAAPQSLLLLHRPGVRAAPAAPSWRSSHLGLRRASLASRRTPQATSPPALPHAARHHLARVPSHWGPAPAGETPWTELRQTSLCAIPQSLLSPPHRHLAGKERGQQIGTDLSARCSLESARTEIMHFIFQQNWPRTKTRPFLGRSRSRPKGGRSPW